MSERSLIERYADAARQHGLASESGNSNIANKMYDKLVELAGELRSAPDRGHEILTQLLKRDDPHVQVWAASHLLAVDSLSAIAALEALGGLRGAAGFNARMVLQEWRAGRLKAT